MVIFGRLLLKSLSRMAKNATEASVCVCVCACVCVHVCVCVCVSAQKQKIDLLAGPALISLTGLSCLLLLSRLPYSACRGCINCVCVCVHKVHEHYS